MSFWLAPARRELAGLISEYLRKGRIGVTLKCRRPAALGGLLFGFDIAIITGAGSILVVSGRWCRRFPQRYARPCDDFSGVDTMDRKCARRSVVSLRVSRGWQGRTFGFLTAMALAPCLFSWLWVRETRNKSLEEMESHWVGTGVATRNASD